MLFSENLAIAVIAFIGIFTTSVVSTPITVPPTVAAEAYLPASMRTHTADEIEAHETLQKRSSAGFNDWDCKPSARHPNPLVLVHGLYASGWNNWLYMGPRFVQEGYCVFALTYGMVPGVPLLAGLDKMETSAAQLSVYVDKVLNATGASQVDMVGHSMGSLMPRYYLKYLGGVSKVDKFAAIGAIVYGTSLHGIIPLLISLGLYDPLQQVVDPVCKSCFQLFTDVPFLKDLNEGGDTVPGVKYLFIASKFDQLVSPYTNGFLRDDNPNVKNQVLQDLCAVDISDHGAQMMNPIVFHKVNAFLDPQADQNINCLDALRR